VVDVTFEFWANNVAAEVASVRSNLSGILRLCSGLLGCSGWNRYKVGMTLLRILP
jgi:hypothetical protein